MFLAENAKIVKSYKGKTSVMLYTNDCTELSA